MKTKQIPAIIMLIAGFITCIVGIFEQFEARIFDFYKPTFLVDSDVLTVRLDFGLEVECIYA